MIPWVTEGVSHPSLTRDESYENQQFSALLEATIDLTQDCNTVSQQIFNLAESDHRSYWEEMKTEARETGSVRPFAADWSDALNVSS